MLDNPTDGPINCVGDRITQDFEIYYRDGLHLLLFKGFLDCLALSENTNRVSMALLECEGRVIGSIYRDDERSGERGNNERYVRN